jgi:hypothetical protein
MTAPEGRAEGPRVGYRKRGAPAWRLKKAALEFAAAVEVGGAKGNDWQRLRRAAYRYVLSEKKNGRPHWRDSLRAAPLLPSSTINGDSQS